MRGRGEPVGAFFGLVLALSIPFWLLDVIEPVQLLPGVPISAIAAFAPVLAALVLAWRSDRLAGAAELLRRSFDLKPVQKPTWLLVAVLTNPVIAVVAFGVMCATGESVPNPSPLTPSVVTLFVVLFVAALGEEIGWSGYATEPLQRRWGPLGAGILLGMAWALWHLIGLVQVGRSPEWIAWWSLGTIGLRVIMGWLYANGGKSVLLAAVFHAMINLSWQLYPTNGSFYDPRLFGLITLCLAAGVLAAERLITKRHARAA